MVPRPWLHDEARQLGGGAGALVQAGEPARAESLADSIIDLWQQARGAVSGG
jgi:hypothetical protein